VPRLPGLLLTLLAGSGLSCCREAKPWDAPDWRPAQPPQRIVAASVFAAEVLLAIAPRERIAAVHYLAADARYSLVAGATPGLTLVGAEPEQLLAVAPDLVVCDAFTRPETLALLAAADVPVVRTAEAASFDDIGANIRAVGRLCHLDEPAERLVRQMHERLRALEQHAPEVATWRVMSLDGALHTYGRPSLFDALVGAAGARALASERGVGPFRRLDLETVLAWQADAFVLGGDGGIGGAGGEVPAWLAQAPGLSQLPCVEKKHLLHIPGPLLGSTSHHLVGAAEALQQQLLRWGRP
jgi:iron complex transport system substrate-binding protein